MIALITGAGRGIGRAIALALAAQGIETVLVARSEEQVGNVAREIVAAGGKAKAYALDITDPNAIDALYEKTSGIGRVSILINNAGIAPSAKIEDTTDEMWKMAFETNVDAPFKLIRAYVPDMKSLGEGRIINIASTAALEGFSYTSAYTSSKHALIGLSRAIARELSRSKIRVSTICPGFVRTNILEASVANIMSKTGKTHEESVAELGAMNKNAVIIEPEEVAAVVLRELEMPLDPRGREVIV
ncbi:MAG: SDR family oxidoreductase [Bacteroidota bacterium]|nr:SDR family oxidoreductase [Bacteroidota bacterium]